MSAPLVSVIVPAYDRLAHLRAAIESVRSQSCDRWELVVADDGSAEPTREYLASLATDARIRVVWLAHTGNPSAVRNAAIRAASGEFLAFLDSDDLWLPRKLERQLAHFDAAPGHGWSYTQVQRIDAEGRAASSDGVRPWRAFEGNIIEPLLRVEALVAMPSVMARRELVLAAGGFDDAQRFCEDYDLWLRLAVRSPASALSEPLACVRVHADNYSQDRIGAYEGWMRLYAKHAAALVEPRLRRICRERHAQSALALASLQHRAGATRSALRTFGAAAATGWWRPSWWWRAARALAGAALPGFPRAGS